MEENFYELINKMYIEMQEGFKDLGRGQEKLENQMILLENDLKPKVEAALDGYNLLNERFDRIERKYDALAVIVQGHDLEIKKLKRAK